MSTQTKKKGRRLLPPERRKKNGGLTMLNGIWTGLGKLASQRNVSRNQVIEGACAEVLTRGANVPVVVAVMLTDEQHRRIRAVTSKTKLSAQTLLHGIISNALKSSDDEMVVASWVEQSLSNE